MRISTRNVAHASSTQAVRQGISARALNAFGRHARNAKRQPHIKRRYPPAAARQRHEVQSSAARTGPPVSTSARSDEEWRYSMRRVSCVRSLRYENSHAAAPAAAARCASVHEYNALSQRSRRCREAMPVFGTAHGAAPREMSAARHTQPRYSACHGGRAMQAAKGWRRCARAAKQRARVMANELFRTIFPYAQARREMVNADRGELSERKPSPQR